MNWSNEILKKLYSIIALHDCAVSGTRQHWKRSFIKFFFRRHNAAAREASSLYQQRAVFSTGLHGSEPRCLWKSPLNAWKRRHKHYSRQPLPRWTSKLSPTPPEQSAEALLVRHREQQARHAPRYKTRVTSTVSWEAVTHNKRALLVFHSGQ